MSKEYLKNVFKKISENDAWSLQVVKFKNSKVNGISYICREAEITPKVKLLEFIKLISDHYCSDEGIEQYASVDDYTGDVLGNCIYKIKNDNTLIDSQCEALFKASANPESETDLKVIGKLNAALFKGNVEIDNESIPVTLISMQNPISTLTNRFVFGIELNKFRELKEPVLTLRKTIDVAIIGDTTYLFSMAGEKLFDLEQTYKAVCKLTVEEIAKCDFLTDKDTFIVAANSGRNPRRFVSYNESHYEALKDVEKRKLLGEKFNFALKEDLIDTTDQKNVERLVKFLCNKAMIDPCDDSPMEVALSKPWQ